jgi:hypothetical protein
LLLSPDVVAKSLLALFRRPPGIARNGSLFHTDLHLRTVHMLFDPCVAFLLRQSAYRLPKRLHLIESSPSFGLDLR